MGKLGYILRENVMDASSDLTDAEFRKLIEGLFNYTLYGEIPNFEGTLKIIFDMEKESIDYNNMRWYERAKKNGWLPKQECAEEWF